MSLLPDVEHGDIRNNIESKAKKEAKGRQDVRSVVFVGPNGVAQERYKIGNSEDFVTVPVALHKMQNPGIEIAQN